MHPLDNPARLQDTTPQKCSCSRCEEDLLFGMRDKFHQFSVPLTTVLECLDIAEHQGYVPPLPADWWILLHRRYPGLAERHNNLYHQKE